MSSPFYLCLLDLISLGVSVPFYVPYICFFMLLTKVNTISREPSGLRHCGPRRSKREHYFHIPSSRLERARKKDTAPPSQGNF